MTPLHHPAEATLLRHAAGGLDAASRVAVATHLHGCARCRDTVRLAEAVGGAMLEQLAPAPMAGDALARALARLDLPAPPPPARPGAGQWAQLVLDGLALPPALAPYGERPGGLGRWRLIAPGIRRIRLLPEAGNPHDRSALYLLKLAPGAAVPAHGHRGAELVAVLAGAYRDRLGRFGPGDLAETEAAEPHRPVAEPGADCVCLIASAAPARFTGRAGRVLGPLLGF